MREIHIFTKDIKDVHMKLIEVLHTEDLFYDIGYDKGKEKRKIERQSYNKLVVRVLKLNKIIHGCIQNLLMILSIY